MGRRGPTEIILTHVVTILPFGDDAAGREHGTGRSSDVHRHPQSGAKAMTGENPSCRSGQPAGDRRAAPGAAHLIQAAPGDVTSSRPVTAADPDTTDLLSAAAR
ncbi:hypothetical protein SALBM217S_00096 [Streptomyces griseoloalbus]